MSSRGADALEARSASPVYVRLALLGALLLAEGVLLIVAFDAAPLRQGPPHWWVEVISRGGLALPLVTAVMTATALLAGTRLRSELTASLVDVSGHRSWPWLVAHLAGFTAFVALSTIVLGTSHAPTSGWWAALWVLTGAASLAALAPAALPMPTLVVFLRRVFMLLGACAVVGAVGVGVGQATSEWWVPLGWSSLWVVYFLVRSVFPDAVIVPESFLVGTSHFEVEIGTRCSGYQGIGLIWVFFAVYLWTFRRSLRFPHALLLLPIGTVLIWLSNALRIAALIWIGSEVSREVALGGFHSNSGSLLFCAVALGLGWAAHHTRFFTRETSRSDAAGDARPVATYLLPFLLTVAAAMVSGLVARDGFDAYYGLRVLVAGTVLVVCWRTYPLQRWPLRRWSGVGWPLAAGVAVAALWILVTPAAEPGPNDTATALAAMPPAQAALWLALRILGAVVTVPLAEEIAFRGYLARRLVAPDFTRVAFERLPWLPIVLSSILFGLLHERFVAATIAGVVYALVARRGGALADAVLAHATTNAILAVWVLQTGQWSQW